MSRNNHESFCICASVLITSVALIVGCLFINKVTGVNPFSTWTIGNYIALLALCPIGALLFYIGNYLLPMTGVMDPNYTPATSVCLSGGILLALLFVIYISFPNTNSDPRNEDVEIRSYVLFVDPSGKIHDNPYCSDDYLDYEHRADTITYLLLDDDFYDKYSVCDICNYVYLDPATGVFHCYGDCINIPRSNHEDVEMFDSLFEFIHSKEELFERMCPYCY